MATLTLTGTNPQGTITKTITFSDADTANILAAFEEASSGQIKNFNQLMTHFTNILAGQIQNVTQRHLVQTNPPPPPPVTIS